jgi:hypothetical protein
MRSWHCAGSLRMRPFGSVQWYSKNSMLAQPTAIVKVVERLQRDFDRAKRILVPNPSDWTQAGRVLARLAAKYHYERMGQGRLTNDALIAMSAERLGHEGVSPQVVGIPADQHRLRHPYIFVSSSAMRLLVRAIRDVN